MSLEISTWKHLLETSGLSPIQIGVILNELSSLDFPVYLGLFESPARLLNVLISGLFGETVAIILQVLLILPHRALR